MEIKKVSLVIPTYNKKERLELVLESLMYQSIDPESYQIVIVDDGSKDGTSDLVKNYKNMLDIKYIYQQNSGRSHARNAGVNSVENEVVVFCDDDLILSKDFIKAHMDMHNKIGNAVVHGTIYNLPYMKFFKNPVSGELSEDANSAGSDLNYLYKHLISKEDVRSMEKIEAQKKLTLLEKNIQIILQKGFSQLAWLAFTGGNVSCRKALLEKCGLFDEELDSKWGCEDIELGYRLSLNGNCFIQCSNASNYHMAHFRASFKEELKESIERFYLKHMNNYIQYLPLLLLGEIKNVHDYVAFVEGE